MSKKISHMSKTVNFDIDETIETAKIKSSYAAREMEINEALDVVVSQMKITGLRDRTIESYVYIFKLYSRICNVNCITEITKDSIYQFLDRDTLTASGKRTQLKQLKAVLNRFYNNDFLTKKFWKDIQVKADKKNQSVATMADLRLLLSLIDTSTYIGFRDSLAIVMMLRTGVRIRTLASIKESNIDFKNKMLILEGNQMKNRKTLHLPLDNQILNSIKIIIEKNNEIKEKNNIKNDYIFITLKGTGVINTKSKTNAISKQLSKYSKKFEIEKINPHAIRRLYAQNLLSKGASVALISQALGHSSLETTSDYLQFTKEEVAQQLKDYL